MTWGYTWKDVPLMRDVETLLTIYSIIPKYCYKKLSDPKYKGTLTALGDVLGELANLCLSLQRHNLTVM